MFSWLKNKVLKKGQEKMGRESLAALARGIHHAASSTYAMLAQQYMHMMMQFFDEKDGKLIAKMTYVQIDENHWAPVPLISLVAPKGIALEKMKVAMSVRIEEAELKAATMDNDGSDADRLSMKVALSPRTKDGEKRASDITDIEMEFVAGEPPEAVMRIIDSFTNLIDPKSFEAMKPPVDTYPPTPISFSGPQGGPAAEGKKADEPSGKP